MKINKELCYIAGLIGNPKKAKIIFKGNDNEIISKLINTAIKEGVDPKKIFVNEKYVYFYNYRFANKIKKILKNRPIIFKRPNQCALAYFAGLFDSRGNTKEISFSHLDTIEKIGLTNLNVHVFENRIINKKFFLTLIQENSVKAKRLLNQ